MLIYPVPGKEGVGVVDDWLNRRRNWWNKIGLTAGSRGIFLA